uniref:Niemann-Pick C1 N-terminal domain-containing protein n=1 Tax=Parascaris equorum TaxID=6256 RepID=A0A914RAD4_PAREQ
MCGVSVAECSISQWFNFMGTYNENIGVPFMINFIVGENKSSSGTPVSPPSTQIVPCSQAPFPGSSACEFAS